MTQSVVIRQAAPNDLKAVVDLIRAGDERPYADANVERFIHGLDPAYSQAWLAEVDGRPVGLSMLYRRALALGDKTFNAGYWANLYIDPAYRNLMLYPRLPWAMFESVKRGELDFIYALVRRANVIEAHTKIGVAKLGDVAVMLKPLRPLRFYVRFKRRPAVLAALGAPIDWMYAGVDRIKAKRRLGVDISAIPWHDSAVEEVADLLRVPLRRMRRSVPGWGTDSADRDAAPCVPLAQAWSAEALRNRFAVSLDGDPYVLLTASRDQAKTGAAVYRTQVRDHGLKVGVVMAIAHQPGHESSAIALLGEIHRRCLADGADAVLALDGQGLAIRRLFRSAGYFDSPQRFTLMLWPKKTLESHADLASPANWQLDFADHDAF